MSGKGGRGKGGKGAKGGQTPSNQGQNSHVIEATSRSTDINNVSPDHATGNDNPIINRLDTLVQELGEMKIRICGIETSLNSKSEQEDEDKKIITGFKNRLNDFDEEIRIIKNDISVLKVDMEKLKKQQSSSHESNLKLEGQSRRSNLLLDGISEEKDETDDMCKKKVYDVLQNIMGFENAQNSINIARAHRNPPGPKRTNSKKPRPIIFKLEHYVDREKIWKKRRSLSGSKLYISEDFPQEIKRRRRVLQPICRAAWKQDKKASMSYDKAFIDGQEFTVNNLDKLPPELEPKKVATPSDGKTTAFYTEASPYSNFHPTQITLENEKVVHCSEQGYQEGKAEFLGDKNAVEAIRKAKTAYACYRIGASIKAPQEKLDDWYENHARDVMYDICYKKFHQNESLKEFLLASGDTEIIEANPHDERWGVGVGINHPDLFKAEKWKGTNWMGKILMQIREELS